MSSLQSTLGVTTLVLISQTVSWNVTKLYTVSLFWGIVINITYFMVLLKFKSLEIFRLCSETIEELKVPSVNSEPLFAFYFTAPQLLNLIIGFLMSKLKKNRRTTVVLFAENACRPLNITKAFVVASCLLTFSQAIIPASSYQILKKIPFEMSFISIPTIYFACDCLTAILIALSLMTRCRDLQEVLMSCIFKRANP
jgi:hypothetical protein